MSPQNATGMPVKTAAPQALAKPETGAIPLMLESKVLAAGAVVWRSHKGELEVLLVDQTSYKAWSIPRGKLDAGELFTRAAVREVKEETGYQIRLGRPMPSRTYRVANGEKTVRYWAAKVDYKVANGPKNPKEIAGMKWYPVAKAKKKAGRAGDRELLTLLERWYLDGELDTHTVAIAKPVQGAAKKELKQGLKAYGTGEIIAGSHAKSAKSLENFARNQGLDLEQVKGDLVVEVPLKDNLPSAPKTAPVELVESFKKSLTSSSNTVFMVKGAEYKALVKQARKAAKGFAKERLHKERLQQNGIEALTLHVTSRGKIVAVERLPK